VLKGVECNGGKRTSGN
jgi:hypothetical protein